MPDEVKGKKTFVIHESAALYDKACVDPSRTSFGDNTVLLPISTLRFLSQLESDPRKGSRAREVVRLIEQYFPDAKTMEQGVRTHGGGIMRVFGINGDGDRNDVVGGDRCKTMVALLQRVKKKYPGTEVILVAKSAGLRTMIRSNSLKAEDLLHGKVIQPQSLASGVIDIDVSELVINEINQAGVVSVDDITLPHGLHPNACCRLRDPRGKSALALFIGGRMVVIRRHSGVDKKGVHPINDEQYCAYELCLRPEIGIVNLVGGAGTGKTLMALLAAEKLRKDPESPIRRIVVFRPLSEVGPSLGTLPGDAKEKFAPWTAPIVANLRFIFRNGESTQSQGVESEGKAKQDKYSKALSMLAGLIDAEIIQISPATFERGTTIDEAFIIIDEAQNFTPHELVTLLTRVGRGSKIVITGDFSQIDNEELDAESCGLAKVLERTQGHPDTAAIELFSVERSPLAAIIVALFAEAF